MGLHGLYTSSQGQDVMQNTKKWLNTPRNFFYRDFKRRGIYAESAVLSDPASKTFGYSLIQLCNTFESGWQQRKIFWCSLGWDKLWVLNKFCMTHISDLEHAILLVLWWFSAWHRSRGTIFRNSDIWFSSFSCLLYFRVTHAVIFRYYFLQCSVQSPFLGLHWFTCGAHLYWMTRYRYLLTELDYSDLKLPLINSAIVKCLLKNLSIWFSLWFI